ncbi:RDD family protein [Pelobacter propionicus]|uniref:RDD domain containing protein n=1 Tax=Pelobacter propionicus (strain DSM 2379 / NBRC 103807 / OttBd1) TaxID=338966 RepID=A1ANR1_PELPD|nr:RDD family protein [Pelobacter propionicus]ABK98981.1 RDD domain containing protein [Pelobacter propionicus DSM 2379]
MFCSNCGSENQDNAGFCSSCGFQLKEISSVKQQAAIRVYAGFWIRFVATLIDFVILLIGETIILYIIVVIFGITVHIIFGPLDAAGYVNLKAIAKILCFITGIILNWCYFTLLETSSKQATAGKVALGLIVTDLNGGRISSDEANRRYWGKYLSTIILCIGYIMAGLTQKKQALHDIMAGTLVIRK